MRSLVLAGLAALSVTPVARPDEPTALAAASAETPKSDDQSRQPERPIAQQYAQIRAEFEAQRVISRSSLLQAVTKAASPRDKREVAKKRPPDLITEFSRRMVDLAESSLDDPAARDALLWVINQPGFGDAGAYGDQFARAAALLVRHHGNDPEAVRIGLTLDNQVSPRRDALLLGFYVAAKGREAKGLARLALAQYLARKAEHVVYARSVEGRPKTRALNAGKVVREFDMTDERYAYHLELRQCDPQVIRAEAERLFEEVISEYGDVPHLTRRSRELEALLKEPRPERNGKPLTAEDRRQIEGRLALKKTLGQEAEARLDEMFNLVVGKPAPEIEGVDVAGKPLKLSDYRGKVVVLVFWGSWCGPCMAQVPRERELVERLKGQPFALLGVDCEPDKDAARRAMARERMTWPNWYDGAPGMGPIANRYHIRGYPSVFLLDARGVIRSRDTWSERLEQAIYRLLEEMKQPASGQGASVPGSEKVETPGL
jgi:thiol-disulfide isomerase/thioredoxin